MKKTSKIVAVVLAALLVVAAVAVLAACGEPEHAAYGYVHGNGVAKATVEFDSEGKIVAATLDEACVPTQVTAEAEDGEFTVTVGNKIYYKTVKWADVTAVYDAEANGGKGGYVVGEQLLINGGAEDSFFALNAEGAARAKAYFEAVAANKVTVVTSSGNRTDVMTAEKLLKSKNGYWAQSEKVALGWKGNVEKTIAYVLANGVEGTLTKDGTWKDANGVDTGATWTDMLNYFNLFKAAAGK